MLCVIIAACASEFFKKKIYVVHMIRLVLMFKRVCMQIF